MRFILTGGNASDDRSAIPLLSGFHARHVIADRAYDSHAILDAVEASGARPIIPQRTCMPRKRAFDPTAYKLRNRIERTIGKLKQLRRMQPDTTASPKTTSQAYTSPRSNSGPECRFSLTPLHKGEGNCVASPFAPILNVGQRDEIVPLPLVGRG